MDEQFRYGLVVKNSSAQFFVVMVVRRLPDWQHYLKTTPPVPQAKAIVLANREGAAPQVGKVVEISGKVGTEYGDWWVVE